MALTMSSGSMPVAASVASDMMSMALAGASLVSMTSPRVFCYKAGGNAGTPGLPVRNLTVMTPQGPVKPQMAPAPRDLSP